MELLYEFRKVLMILIAIVGCFLFTLVVAHCVGSDEDVQ